MSKRRYRNKHRPNRDGKTYYLKNALLRDTLGTSLLTGAFVYSMYRVDPPNRDFDYGLSNFENNSIPATKNQAIDGESGTPVATSHEMNKPFTSALSRETNHKYGDRTGNHGTAGDYDDEQKKKKKKKRVWKGKKDPKKEGIGYIISSTIRQRFVAGMGYLGTERNDNGEGSMVEKMKQETDRLLSKTGKGKEVNYSEFTGVERQADFTNRLERTFCKVSF